ncbi:MAG: glycoside hydrolase family 57 protein [Chloroflexota bacterium]
MNPKQGYFAFVLHSHLPYVRLAGRWPHGEEMVHEALAETYIPLLNALYDLKAEGVEPRLTIGLTPILLEQISDPSVLEHFELYLAERNELAREDVQRHSSGRLHELANFYLDWYADIGRAFEERYQRDLVGAFRRLQDEGNLDIITSAATHAYLPLVARDSTIHAQVKTGVESYQRRFGRAPRGIWLPECAYRPAYMHEDGATYYKPGIEEFLAQLNLAYFFSDTHVIEGSELVGKATGDAVGPYGAIPLRRAPAQTATRRPEPAERTTMRPYFVRQSPVSIFGRDARTGLQVWSAAQGYPGDFVYREFHRKDDQSGLQYWRITGAGVDLGDKDLYDPAPAAQQVLQHARHFVDLVHQRVREHAAHSDVPGVVISAYDTELFGHWWFEGVAWIKEVCRLLAASDEVGLISADGYLQQFPPEHVLNVPESSWGTGGGHWTWLNPGTEWLWPHIHAAERQMERLVEMYPSAEGGQLRLLNQIAREALLLESSDWPFLISTGQAKEYASARFQQHVARFNRLVQVALGGRLSEQNERFLTMVEEVDNPFAKVDYRDFANREQSPVDR